MVLFSPTDVKIRTLSFARQADRSLGSGHGKISEEWADVSGGQRWGQYGLSVSSVAELSRLLGFNGLSFCR